MSDATPGTVPAASDLAGLEFDLPAAEVLLHSVMSDGGLCKLAECTDQDCESLYAMGFGLYSQAHYADALKIFALLVTLKGLEPRFLKGLAACLQMTDQPAEAIRHYATAIMLDVDDPAPLLHTAECLLMLGHVEHASECLEMIASDYSRTSFTDIVRHADKLASRIAAKK